MPYRWTGPAPERLAATTQEPCAATPLRNFFQFGAAVPECARGPFAGRGVDPHDSAGLRGGTDAPRDDAYFHWAAWARDRKSFVGEIAQMQLDRLARIRDRVLNRAARRRTPEDVRHRHAVKARVIRLLDLDPETQAAWANTRLRS
jgi:hypothetical protein